MTEQPRPCVSFTQEFQVLSPKDEIAIPIPESQWVTLMKRIDECGESLDWHWGIGWAAIGVAATCALSAITLYASVDLVREVGGKDSPNLTAIISIASCIALTLASAAVAFNSLYYSRCAAEHCKKVRTMIVEDMRVRHEMYKAHAAKN